MSYLGKITLATVLLTGAAAIAGPGARAQSAAELNVRMSQVEDQMRQLIGQVEQLSFEMRQLRDQIGQRKVGGAEPQPVAPARKQKITATAATEQGIEQVGGGYETSQLETIITDNGDGQQVAVQKAPQPKMLGTLPGTDFEGEVLVPPQPSEPGAVSADQVETVALAPAGDTPEMLYERSYESLLRRRFGDAESGFRGFLDQYRSHALAGNAQYWLGETYYVQGDYKAAAQTFLGGVQDYPKSRKAPDSLLKLGLSLNRLGQKQQACAAYGAVGDKFPKAVEAKKRADAEAKRSGC